MIDKSRFSRRCLLRGIALSVVGASSFGAAAAAEQAKRPQKGVDYRTVAEGPSRCDSCRYFKAPAACLVVEGSIAPTGWCSMYLKKPE